MKSSVTICNFYSKPVIVFYYKRLNLFDKRVISGYNDCIFIN